MEPLVKSLWVGLGAFVGANLRFWIGEWMGQRDFPWATLAINVLGSLVIGVFFAWEIKQNPSHAYRLLIAVGLCGGFTTFSAFSWESLRLMERGHWDVLGLYVSGSIVLTVAACATGFAITKSLLGG